ncbi:MAG: sugar phosphate isomerase/epimerase [Vicinamibacterales bacterium]
MPDAMNRRTFAKAVLTGLGATAMPVTGASPATQTAAGSQGSPAKQLRIGCTSLVWGVFPRAPEPLETAVRDMSELGYKGFETFGHVVEDWDKKGTLERLISQYKIPLISAYAPLNVIDPSVRQNEIATIVRWGKILRKYGATFLVIEAGGAKRAGYDFAAHRANIVSALNDYGKAMADLGVGSGLHQHTGTAIETRDEVYAVMESVDTRIFKFAPDVGQLQKGGADAAKIVKDFASITVHMHLKDFVSGPHMGGYSPLGIGMVDLKSILETMEQANPKANIMHELDPSRNMPYTPRQTAEISKWYLQKLGYMLGS